MSLVLLGSTSGSVTLQEPAIAGSTVIDLPATSGTMAVLPTATSVLPEASGGTGTTTGYYGFKNRIINGAMVIDQRNAGASVTPTSGSYTLDRWTYAATQSSKFSLQQNAGSVTPPVGFVNYLGLTSLSAYSIVTSDLFGFQQRIEGFNTSDLAWGTANAASVTLSFWVRSSLTGTFGGSVRNHDASRSQPFSYTISAANTWEYKTVTIAGDTSGTWPKDNGIGLRLSFGLGVGSNFSSTAGSWGSGVYLSATGATSVVGTNGATWYVTGVQLEIGTSATPFERRMYGQELALCQRYYWRFNGIGGATIFSAGGLAVTTTRGDFAIQNPVSMRSVPSAIDYASLGITLFGTSTTAVTSASLVTATSESSLNFTVVQANVASGLTQFRPYNLSATSASSYIGATAEL